jgi:hypothetical protein
MKQFVEALGGRKFFYAQVVTIGVFVLAVLGKVSYEQLLSFLTWIFGIFVTGNVAQKFTRTEE